MSTATKCIAVENGLIVLLFENIDSKNYSRLNNQDIKTLIAEWGIIITIKDIRIPLTEKLLGELIKKPTIYIYNAEAIDYEMSLVATVEFPSEQVSRLEGAYLFSKSAP
jgi:hypothetical protein